MVKSRRIEWVDIAKGIAILLMVIGHELPQGALRCFIFSFHMPLFFILSGFTSSAVTNYYKFYNKQLKSFKSIWLLAALMILLSIIEGMILARQFSLINLLKNWNTAIYNGSNTLNSSSPFPTSQVGVMWFMFVFFWAKLLYEACQLIFGKAYSGIVLGILAYFSFIISQHIWLPQALDIAPIAALFMWSGYLLREIYNKKDSINIIGKQLILTAFFCFWIWCLQNSLNMEMSTRYYPKFILTFLEAVAGTISISVLSSSFVNLKWLNWLKIIGKHTLAILCIHHLDLYWIFWDKYIASPLLAVIIRLMVDLCLLVIYLLIIKLFKRHKLG